MFFPFSNKISSHNSTISSTPRGSCENLVFSCSHNLASGVSVRTEPKRALVATDRNVSRVEKEFRSRSKVLFDPKSDIIVIVVITGSDTKVTGSCSEWKTKNVSVASTVIEPSSRFCQKILKSGSETFFETETKPRIDRTTQNLKIATERTEQRVQTSVSVFYLRLSHLIEEAKKRTRWSFNGQPASRCFPLIFLHFCCSFYRSC